MNEELEKDLKSLAKKHGMKLSLACEYCQEASYSDGGETACHMVTFTGPSKE